MKPDPALEEVWKARDRISQICDYDTKKLVEFYKEKQKQRKEKVARAPR